MPRSPRPATGGIVTHVLNRSNARLPLFEHDGDYELFEHALEQAHARTAVRILSYCVTPNHWHLAIPGRSASNWRRVVDERSIRRGSSDPSRPRAVAVRRRRRDASVGSPSM